MQQSPSSSKWEEELAGDRGRFLSLLIRRPLIPSRFASSPAMWIFVFRIAAFISFFLHGCSADDAVAMAKLASALSPAPLDWRGRGFCSWSGVKCDKSDRVIVIRIASTGVSGTLPSEINQLERIEILALQDNSLSGALPTLENMSSLQELYLDDNEFTSVPSGFLQGLTSLRILSINQNTNLRPWEIPAGLTHCAGLVTFSASNSNVGGTIPDIFRSLPNLQNLKLSYNNLTGNLPESFSGSGIQYLLLNNQELGLTGRIDVLGKMTHLRQSWLHKNEFTGPIPDLSECTSLFDLQLRDNQLTGVIPSSLLSIKELTNVTMQNNRLQGPQPVVSPRIIANPNSFCRPEPGPCDPQVTALLEICSDVGYPMILVRSWEGNSACNGWIFISCDGKIVVTVNFGKQGFAGKISPAFSDLKALRNLHLNDNKLAGSIPESLSGLKNLKLLDVSNNNLSGKIPSSLPSDLKLVAGGNEFLGSELEDDGSSSSSRSRGFLIAVFIAVTVLAVITGTIAFVSSRKKKTRDLDRIALNAPPFSDSSRSSSTQAFEPGIAGISVHLLRELTNNFGKENEIGRGGFGVVYRAELRDGKRIAVKRMESASVGSTKGMNEFEAEIAVLTKVRHRHLVGLLGFCEDGRERLLVYEFMSGGTLAQRLFQWRERGTPPLLWKQRVSIALDVARGVEYLHSLAQQSFIHRDLKPSNILLSDDARAKVADFGLVKNAPEGTSSTLETRLAGTFGYLAPEYAATGRVTTKVDVYAFGVIMMELITGRKSLDDAMPDEKSHLVSWFRKVVTGAGSAIDEALDQNLDLCESSYESMKKFAELARQCTSSDPFQRPDMGHVVSVLSPLVQLWKPAELEEEDDDIVMTMSLPEALERWRTNDGVSVLFTEPLFLHK